MYIHTSARFCKSQRRFFSLPSLKYLYIFFTSACLISLCSLPAAVIPSSTPQARGHPCPSLLPPFLHSLRLPSAPPACRVFRGCRAVCPLSISPFVPIGRALEALRRPAVLSPLSGCPLVAAVTRPPSGAKRYDSGGRCTAYMSPALSPLAYVLPCVPLPVPWLPCVRPCVCPAAVCRLVVVIGGTPLYPGRRRCGAASGV